MNTLSNGFPIIIRDKTGFSAFWGFVHGTITSVVYDNGTNEFPARIDVDTNLGSGGAGITLRGNETVEHDIKGITVKASISNWQVSPQELSFHAKIEIKKGFFSTTILDKTLRGQRFNAKAFEQLLANALEQAEALQSNG